MKNPILFLVVGIVLLSSSLYSQITFERWYGGISYDSGLSVQQTKDGGYVITGTTCSYGAGNFDVYLIKTDSLGDTLWTKTYGGTQYEHGNSVKETTDGGYIITGVSSSYSSGSVDVYLVKTDSLGDTLWTKNYGGNQWDEGYSVVQTTDGGYIAGGYTLSYGAGWYDIYLLKTDSLGDTLWTRTYGDTLEDFCLAIHQTEEGNFIILGYTGSYGIGSYDVYLMKTDSLGDTLWTNTYGGIFDDYGLSIQPTTSGGYIIGGYTFSFGPGDCDFYLIKTDSLGDTLWTGTYGGTNDDYGWSVSQTSDKGFIMTGYTYSYGAGSSDIFLVKTDSLGNTLWTRTYGGTATEVGSSIQNTTDEGNIIAGCTDSYGVNGDVYLIKIYPFALFSPNGGEIFFSNDTIPITWFCEKFKTTKHTFQLLFSSDSGNTYSDTIATSISQDSTSWQWCVPTIYTSTCKVKIQAFDTLNNLLEEDESDSNFTIQDGINPTAEIHKPNGGEVFSIGTIEPVTWEASDNIGIDSIVLEYSTNGGSDWTYVASPPSSDTIYYWVIPPTPSAECLMKVKAFDAIMNMAEDISDSLFEVRDDSIPRVTVIIPNGGEVWNGNEVHAIRWYSDDNVGIDSVNITLSLDGGTTFPVFVSHIVGNDSIYQWVVPETTSTECIMKIEAYDAAEHVGFDISDSTFVIITEVDVSGSENPIPHKTLLRSIAPNPFRHNTKIYFQIAKRTLVSAELFDVSGRHFETIIDKEYIPGYYSVTVCNTITSGIYFLKIKTGKKEWFRKIVKIQ
jgi:hypothetical protein